MPDPAPLRPLRVAELPRSRATAFAHAAGAEERRALAAELGLAALARLRFAGRITPEGRADWLLEAELEAEVEQPCVVTLAPVRSLLREGVVRRFRADLPAPPPGETEMPEDDSLEPLGPEIDLPAILHEALALALPLYPRAPGAALPEPPPDEGRRPFAGLAALRARLGGPGTDG